MTRWRVLTDGPDRFWIDRERKLGFGIYAWKQPPWRLRQVFPTRDAAVDAIYDYTDNLNVTIATYVSTVEVP